MCVQTHDVYFASPFLTIKFNCKGKIILSVLFFMIHMSDRSDRSRSGFLLLGIVCVNYLTK